MSAIDSEAGDDLAATLGTERAPELSADGWRAVLDTAQTAPLAHPLPFAEGCIGYDYPTPPHLMELYGAVYRAVSPEYPNAPKQLLRLMPRDHGKSEAGSVVFPSWLALRNPNARILLMMHKEGKAAGKLQQCANIIDRLAPHFGHEIKYSTKTALTLERDENHDVPTIEAAGYESGVTGGHYTTVVFDDTVTRETQSTEDQRQKAQQKFQNYLNLGDEGDTTFLVLGTRKHKDDLYGWLDDKPTWDSVTRKAITDFSVVENGEFDLITDSGTLYPADQRGSLPPDENLVDVEPHRDVEVLWPERYSLSDLIFEYLSASGSADDTISSSAEWRREKLNTPDALSGTLLAEDMLSFHDELPPGVNPRDLVNFAGIDIGIVDDPAKAASADADYWALNLVGYHPEQDTAYLRHLTRRRGMTVNEAAAWTQRELRPYDYGTVHVESVQAQDFFRQALADEGVPTTPVTPSRQKESRVISMSSWFENGRCRIIGDPDSAIHQALVNEWVEFPTSSHDDLVDSLSISLTALGEWINQPRATLH